MRNGWMVALANTLAISAGEEKNFDKRANLVADKGSWVLE